MVKEALLPTAGLLSPCDPVETVPLNDQLAFSRWQQDIPDEYRGLDAPQLVERIAAAKAMLAERLVILGHHYQRDDVIRHANQRGDSFKLAQWAARNPQADYIVFCGVHFMAESADILCAPHQQVVLPNMTAGCSMADMASLDDVMSCWDELAGAGLSDDTLPVTYINSSAALKAFCGRRGGVVCTSSNAPAVFRWALARKRRILFFPDEHLGRVTGRALGVPLAQMPVWDRRLSAGSLGGNDIAALRDSRIILWNGYCGVHQRFTVDQVRRVRERYPDIRVVVHPECRLEVVEAADSYGSTEHIIRAVGESPPGSRWAVGTEINLVNRLGREHRDKTVLSLDPDPCPCSTMYRIHPAYLCWVLERLVDGEVVNRVTVEPETAHWAKLALERMLAIA
jgi:quinolinate synthase